MVVFRLVPHKLATETFEYLSPEKQQKLIVELAQEKERLAALLNDRSPDDRTALLEELLGPVVQRLLSMLSLEELNALLLGEKVELLSRIHLVFRGELVPQDPNDEPASVLLERIREEQASKQGKSQDKKLRSQKKQKRQVQLELDI